MHTYLKDTVRKETQVVTLILISTWVHRQWSIFMTPTLPIHSMFPVSAPHVFGVLSSVGWVTLCYLKTEPCLDSPAHVKLLQAFSSFPNKWYCPKGHHWRDNIIIPALTVQRAHYFSLIIRSHHTSQFLFIFFLLIQRHLPAFPKHLGSWFSSSSMESLLGALVEAFYPWVPGL